MGKKITLTLVMSILLVGMTAITGMAAPSRTVRDMTNVDKPKVQNPDPSKPAVNMDVIDSPEKSNDPKVKAMFEELDKMQDFMKNASNDIVGFFDSNVKKQIEELLPKGFDLGSLELSEFVAVNTLNYDNAFGDVTAEFEFPTQYEVGQELVALIGVFDDKGDATWLPQEAEAVAVGKVEIVITEEAFETIGDSPFALGILSETE